MSKGKQEQVATAVNKKTPSKSRAVSKSPAKSSTKKKSSKSPAAEKSPTKSRQAKSPKKTTKTPTKSSPKKATSPRQSPKGKKRSPKKLSPGLEPESDVGSVEKEGPVEKEDKDSVDGEVHPDVVLSEKHDEDVPAVEMQSDLQSSSENEEQDMNAESTAAVETKPHKSSCELSGKLDEGQTETEGGKIEEIMDTTETKSDDVESLSPKKRKHDDDSDVDELSDDEPKLKMAKISDKVEDIVEEKAEPEKPVVPASDTVNLVETESHGKDDKVVQQKPTDEADDILIDLDDDDDDESADDVMLIEDGAEKNDVDLIQVEQISQGSSVGEEPEDACNALNEYEIISKDEVPSADSDEIAQIAEKMTPPISMPTDDTRNVCPSDNGCISSDVIFTREYVPNRNLGAHPDAARCFSIVSYNILADVHAQKDYTGTRAPWITEAELSLSTRHELLMKELKYLDSDIICLQEVGGDHMKLLLEPEMER